MLDLMKNSKKKILTVLAGMVLGMCIVSTCCHPKALAKGSFGGGRSSSSFSSSRSSSSFGGSRSSSSSSSSSRSSGGSSFGGNRSAPTASKPSTPPTVGRASSFGGNRATSGPVTVTRPQPPEYNRGYSWGRTYYPGYGYSYHSPYYGGGFSMWHYLLFWELMQPRQQAPPLVVNEQGMVMQNPGYQAQPQSGGGFFSFLLSLIMWSVIIGAIGGLIYVASKHVSWR